MSKTKAAEASAEVEKTPAQLGREAFKAGQNIEEACAWRDGEKRAEFFRAYDKARGVE